MRIAITGHRPVKLDNDYGLTSQLIANIKKILQELLSHYVEITPAVTPVEMISGMALGIDTLWALMAIENDINLTAAIPCKNQDLMWAPKSKAIYRDIISHPLVTPVMVSDKSYFPSCMQLRNEWMVDNCDLLIAVWDGSAGGTGNCIKYANQQGVKTICINPKDLTIRTL